MLVGGCVVLGTGVAMLLTADLGSDGYSTLVNGVSIGVEMPFFVANLAVSVVFLALAAARRVRPGIGTVVQILVVGFVADRLLRLLDTPDSVTGAEPAAGRRIAGAGRSASRAISAPSSAPGRSRAPDWRGTRRCRSAGATAPCRLLGALVGWLLGATIGPGTVAVDPAARPAVDLTSRMLRLDVHQRIMDP